MSWRLTVRAGSRVERLRFDEAAQALEALELRAHELVGDAPNKARDVRYKRYEPVEQVFARLELSGPERFLPSIHVGLDVRGDGSVEAFQGRMRRELIEPASDETPYSSLRRTVER